MPRLAVEQLSVRYADPAGEGPVLQDVSFTLEAGEIGVVLGASGCGKTTLLNALAGFLPPTAGRILLDGRPVRGPGAERGVVLQKQALFPWLTAGGNVEFPLRLRGWPRRKRRAEAEAWLERLGLAGCYGRPLHQLSGGMCQRVELARALAADPAILLLDEPFGALDAFTRESLQILLLTLWRDSGKSLFFITHSVEEAAFLGSEVLVLSPRPGRVVHHAKLAFNRAFLHSGDVRAVKADPAFIAARERLLEAVHASQG